MKDLLLSFINRDSIIGFFGSLGVMILANVLAFGLEVLFVKPISMNAGAFVFVSFFLTSGPITGTILWLWFRNSKSDFARGALVFAIVTFVFSVLMFSSTTPPQMR